ncbi:MAG: tryptophan--tRNA ligase, partial [Chloroflexota bacterium]|nr:tryptophan--tRNA ligase [Chloroflexota bacterium]
MPTARHNGSPKQCKRLLTGLRPTGKFHLGNYVGTLEKDVELQNSGEYECFILIADYHTLTTGYESSRSIGDDIREGVLD